MAATESGNLLAGIVSVLGLTPFFYAGFDTIPLSRPRRLPAEGLNWERSSARSSPLALLAAGGFYMVRIHPLGPPSSGTSS